jgi:hypothetical protein
MKQGCFSPLECPDICPREVQPVITFFSGTDIPVFLLNIFAKSEKTDLTPKERRVLKSVLASIVETYRSGSRRESK